MSYVLFTFLVLIVLILMIIGIIGLVNPVLPGLPLIFVALWIIAYLGDYQYISVTVLVILFILTLLGLIFDYLAGMLGAKSGGASQYAIYGSLIGSIVGIFFSLPGIILGSTIGAMLGEFVADQKLLQTGKVGLATLIGFVIGTALKIGIAFSMLIFVIFIHGYYWIFS